jgi:hypothetical protein
MTDHADAESGRSCGAARSRKPRSTRTTGLPTTSESQAPDVPRGKIRPGELVVAVIASLVAACGGMGGKFTFDLAEIERSMAWDKNNALFTWLETSRRRWTMHWGPLLRSRRQEGLDRPRCCSMTLLVCAAV